MIYYLICSFFFSLDACDLGGPRRHFFTLLLREIYEKMTKDGKFLYNDQFQRNSYYHAAGVFIGKHLVDLPFSHNGTIVIILASHRWMTYNLIDTQSPDLYSIMNHMIILCMLLPSFNLLGIIVLGNVALGHHIIWWNILIPCVTLPCKINSQFLFSLQSLFYQVNFLSRWYHQTRRAPSHMMLYMKVL